VTDEWDELEEQLRELPPPVPSAELEQRLLAHIPQVAARHAKPLLPARTIVVLATACAAIVMIGIALALQFGVDPPTARDSQPTSPLIAPSPQLALDTDVSPGIQETRPCDVLPPLPDLY
jgi:hypothetical protein